MHPNSKVFPRLDVLYKEAALTGRTLRKERSFTILSVALLALGIGLASAVFTLLWQAIYAQLPVPEPDRIFAFSTNVTHNGRSDSDAMAQTISAPAYRYLAEHFKVAAGTVARHGEMVNMETPGGSRHLLADFVSGNFFGVLRVKTVIGRAIEPGNDTLSDDRFVTVLSYDFWQEAYGGQVLAWNSILRVNGVPFRIIGIAPSGFHGLIAGQSPKIYVPVATYADLNSNWREYDDWALRWLNSFVRLPAGVAAHTAEAQLQTVYREAVRQELSSEGPQSPNYLKELSHERVSLVPASQGDHAQVDTWGEPLRVLQWMTLAVLLLAAINVAGLMLVRAVKQKQEMLIRYAVGATRSAVMRLHLLQTLILAILGGLLGLWIARFGAQLLVHLARMDRSSAFIYRPHGWTLVLHWVAALLAGLLAGILPAWQTARIDLASGLTEGALTHSATRSQALARRTLAAAQIALSLVLAIAAGLFAKALHKLVSVPVGFEPEHLTVFSIDPKFAHSTIQSTELLWANLERRLRETAGVQAVTYGTGGPFPQGDDVALVTPGVHSDPTNHYQSGRRSIIGAAYFSTLGIRIVSGREFDDRDRASTPGAVIINETLAHKLFGSNNAVGQMVTMFNGLDPDWLANVAGVVADHHQSWRRANASLIYTPASQATRAYEMTYYVRTRAAALPEQAIRNIVHQEAPAISPYDIANMQTRMAEFASADRAMAILVSAFASLALVIAIVGIYGVVAYGASLRTAEFGIRVSVGAQPANILWLVLREAILILSTGIIMAAPLSYFALSVVRHQLQGISLHEPVIYSSAILLLTACTLAASFLPARKATKMSVHGALRYQ